MVLMIQTYNQNTLIIKNQYCSKLGFLANDTNRLISIFALDDDVIKTRASLWEYDPYTYHPFVFFRDENNAQTTKNSRIIISKHNIQHTCVINYFVSRPLRGANHLQLFTALHCLNAKNQYPK